MLNPIVDLLDQAKSPEEEERLVKAFSKGVIMGSHNILEAYGFKIKQDLQKLNDKLDHES